MQICVLNKVYAVIQYKVKKYFSLRTVYNIFKLSFSINMPFPNWLEPLLKQYNLVGFLINDGWILIRRRNYIDLYIDTQPYNSVAVLIHLATMVSGAKILHLFAFTYK